MVLSALDDICFSFMSINNIDDYIVRTYFFNTSNRYKC